MKKWTWIVIGCLCISLVAYGVTAFNDSPASAEQSKESKGSFVRLEDGAKKIVIMADGKETVYSLSATAWVYRNMQKSKLDELQPGDSLDLILNSKEQAAYIKASSPQTAAQPQSPAQGGSPAEGKAASEGTPAPTDVSGGVPSGPPAPASEAQSNAAAAGSASATQLQRNTSTLTAGQVSAAPKEQSVASANSASSGKAIDKLAMEWKSRELQLRIKLDPSAPGKSGSELYVQAKDRTVMHLTGPSAEPFIQLLLKGLPTERQAFEQALKQKIADEFQVNESKPEWKMDVKWRDASAPALSSDQGKGNVQEKNKNKQKEEKTKDDEKGKERDKKAGHGKGHDREDD
ncbi:hypothetical protein [Paenibacillus piri]|uniref:DUF4340 domain-containing protein n=1 Tax=Paenibacillus piri TaxID=2547395 RepID=A0A4R5KAG6_9BACL|nr:hypothetical protein [Paenibacillus piri]TDF92121.1 hypothetical protein E1757_30440 [Paenibacillus piri]